MQNNSPDILKKIIKFKLKEIEADKDNQSFDIIKDKALSLENNSNFYNKLKQKIDNCENSVIAEIKKASPSKGILRENFNPIEIAKDYQKAGATCLSILTDKQFFQGDNQYVIDIAKSVNLPILRKEFIIDKYQIYQAKTLGASCILLIAAILSKKQMLDFQNLATDLGMDTLVEVHNQEELDKTSNLNLKMLGINNRNLRTFEVSLSTTINLLTQVKDKIIITESGILTQEDVKIMNNNGVYGFLVGEVFMREDNIVSKFKDIF